MSKIYSIFTEINSLLRNRDIQNHSDLKAILEEDGGIDIRDYLSKDINEKIDILVFLFSKLVSKCDATQITKLDFLIEFAFKLNSEVPIEEFKAIFDDISIKGTENQIMERYLDRLNGSSPPKKLKLFVIEDDNVNSRNFDTQSEMTFTHLLKKEDLPNIDTDLIIKKGNNCISIQQYHCQGDVDFFYFDTEEILLQKLIYFSSQKEIFLIISITENKDRIVFNTLKNRKQYTFEKGRCYSASKNEISLEEFGFTFIKKNNDWYAVKNSGNDLFFKAFHDKSTFTRLSESISLSEGDKKVIMIHDVLYTLYYSH